MQFITDFADQAVVLPLIVIIAAGLALSGWLRGCCAWVLAVLGMVGTMALLKYVCFACQAPLSATGLRSPSGHTAAAAVVYGGALVLLLRQRAPSWLLFAIPPIFAAFFALTRLALHAHDVAEVLVGGAVGLTFVAALVVLAGPRPPLRAWPMTVVAVIIAVAFHGLRLKAEDVIHHSMLLNWIPLPATCRA